MSEKVLYFIAIIPPKEVYDEIKNFQKVMSDKFDSRKSFGHIPHITLVPPFRINLELEKELFSLLKNVKVKLNELKLKNFNHFKKHTIYIDIEYNEELEKLHSVLFESLNTTNWFDKKLTYFQRYNPHITIGYRDLENTFKEAWQYFENQNYEHAFKYWSISLLKHDGEKWGIV